MLSSSVHFSMDIEPLSLMISTVLLTLAQRRLKKRNWNSMVNQWLTLLVVYLRYLYTYNILYTLCTWVMFWTLLCISIYCPLVHCYTALFYQCAIFFVSTVPLHYYKATRSEKRNWNSLVIQVLIYLGSCYQTTNTCDMRDKATVTGDTYKQ